MRAQLSSLLFYGYWPCYEGWFFVRMAVQVNQPAFAVSARGKPHWLKPLRFWQVQVLFEQVRKSHQYKYIIVVFLLSEARKQTQRRIRNKGSILSKSLHFIYFYKWKIWLTIGRSINTTRGVSTQGREEGITIYIKDVWSIQYEMLSGYPSLGVWEN